MSKELGGVKVQLVTVQHSEAEVGLVRSPRTIRGEEA